MANWSLNAASGRVLRGIVVAVALLPSMQVVGCARGASDDVVESDAAPANETKYVPEADEGLGVSIAIVVDNSGSMSGVAGDDNRPKFVVAREALEAMIASTDSFVARHAGLPVNVGLIRFSGDVERLVPIGPYDRDALLRALSSMSGPSGGTAIGSAMDAAREELYRAGTIRKYILVVTDGENTNGRSPKAVAREIFRRSEGAIRIYFVAFDVDAEKFAFLREVRGEVMGASNGAALRASLDTIYQGRILAEAPDAGETLKKGKP